MIDPFFVGRQLQRKPEPNASNALIYKKDAYFIIQEVSNELKQVKQRRSGKELELLFFNVKKLEEKLLVESDFGYGSAIVIECETNIAKQLQFLRDMLPYIESGSINDNISKMNSAVVNINSLLTRRRELKKK